MEKRLARSNATRSATRIMRMPSGAQKQAALREHFARFGTARRACRVHR